MSLIDYLIPSLSRPRAGSTTNGAEPHSAIKPAYDVSESADAFRLTVQLPGVSKDGLELTIEQNELRIQGRRAWRQPADWTGIHRETAAADYELTLTHDNAIDAEKVVAELVDGVLQVTLPKQEALKPRKIAVA